MIRIKKTFQDCNGHDADCGGDEFCAMTGVNDDKTAHFECAKKLEKGQNCAKDNWCIKGHCNQQGKCDYSNKDIEY